MHATQEPGTNGSLLKTMSLPLHAASAQVREVVHEQLSPSISQAEWSAIDSAVCWILTAPAMQEPSGNLLKTTSLPSHAASAQVREVVIEQLSPSTKRLRITEGQPESASGPGPVMLTLPNGSRAAEQQGERLRCLSASYQFVGWASSASTPGPVLLTLPQQQQCVKLSISCSKRARS